MRSAAALVTLSLLACVPATASAQSLEWAGGAANLILSSTSTTRCTLFVTPSPGQALLPPRWRLFWTGRSAVEPAVQIVAGPGPAGAAPVCDLRFPVTNEDRLSRTSTAEFCGPGDGLPSERAAYVLLLHPSLEARLMVTPEFGASDGQATEPSEVTVNGGTDQAFPASLRTYRAISDTLGAHRAGLVGRGLDRVQSARLMRGGSEGAAEDLEILTQTDQTLILETPASIGAEDVLVLSNGDGEPASALLIEDPDPEPGSSTSPSMVPPYPIEAKDFAFIYHEGFFHIFYIRINPTVHDSLDEVDFGHAVSSNLYNWTQLPPVLHTRPDKWDNGHVWAPSIVEQDGTFYMFYTGVTKNPANAFGYQRIGLAVSTDLYNWTRFDTPLFDCAQAPWTECNYSTYEGSQFRDPFVMIDPNDPTRWLMYYVAPPDVAPNQMIAGVASSPALSSGWSNLVPLWTTDGFPNNLMGWCESPIAFLRNSTWYLFLSTNSGHPIRYKFASNPIADSTQWTGPYRLFDAPGAGNPSDQWIAPEFLRVDGHDYLAVVSRAAVSPGVEIREVNWGGPYPGFSLVWPERTGVPVDSETGGLAISLISPLGRAGADLRVELTTPGPARVEIFDVSGRRVARVLDRWLASGPTECRWDGRSAAGRRQESGVYFARLTSRGESRAIRVPHQR